jgi:hypothetical protein
MNKKRWANFLYKKIGLESDPCVYCGSASECWDHVPPIHFITRIIQLEITILYECQKVRACMECNLALKGYILTTFLERQQYLFDYYFTKNNPKGLRVLFSEQHEQHEQHEQYNEHIIEYKRQNNRQVISRKLAHKMKLERQRLAREAWQNVCWARGYPPLT